MKAGRFATVATVAAACAAVGLIVASCTSQTGGPSDPSSTLGRAQNILPVPTASPSPSPSPSGQPCSPGFWKNHAINSPGNQPNLWYGIGFGVCDGAGQPTCASLLSALQAGGQQSQAAAAYLNSQTGNPPFPAHCTESD